MTNHHPSRRIHRRLFALAAVASLALGACGGDDDDGGPVTAADLDGRTFVAESVDGAMLVSGSTLTLSFSAGRVATFGGCNTSNGAFTVENGTLVVQPMVQTMMACVPDELMQQDTWVNEFLTSSPTITLDDEDLRLATDAITIEFDEGTADS